MHSSKPGYLSQLLALAQHGAHDPLQVVFAEARSQFLNDDAFQNELGALVLKFGYLTLARSCFEQVLASNPDHFDALLHLSNVYHNMAQSGRASELMAQLLERNPNHQVVRRNFLLAQEYDPGISDALRFEYAKQWGQWAVEQSGGWRVRPSLTPRAYRKLRIGYVSADVCQHTVGLFFKEVVKQHSHDQFEIFVYSHSTQIDWVTDQVRARSQFRMIGQLTDQALAAQIRSDAIDIVVDLSGHTAGSRLQALAYRPAPVMITWLGYFATTGLPYMDTVLLDKAHCTPNTQDFFSEWIETLEPSRLCYQPVPWAQETPVGELPAKTNGYVTFASFNNTAKLNESVLQLWSRILQAIPSARLLLKWRTFVDDEYAASVKQFFVKQGIEPQRISLEPASFHADLFAAYSRADIALDPFPFSGGLTSCEALWMGLPLITLPQSRVVSRQSASLLQAIGITQTLASDEDHYVQIGKELAGDLNHLSNLRTQLRIKMQGSTLMDSKAFTLQLEDCYRSVFDHVFTSQNNSH
jgi:predicted O-linked N-acetylglucosamine transferase (SPINDLY family)